MLNRASAYTITQGPLPFIRRAIVMGKHQWLAFTCNSVNRSHLNCFQEIKKDAISQSIGLSGHGDTERETVLAGARHRIRGQSDAKHGSLYRLLEGARAAEYSAKIAGNCSRYLRDARPAITTTVAARR